MQACGLEAVLRRNSQIPKLQQELHEYLVATQVQYSLQVQPRSTRTQQSQTTTDQRYRNVVTTNMTERSPPPLIHLDYADIKNGYVNTEQPEEEGGTKEDTPSFYNRCASYLSGVLWASPSVEYIPFADDLTLEDGGCKLMLGTKNDEAASIYFLPLERSQAESEKRRAESIVESVDTMPEALSKLYPLQSPVAGRCRRQMILVWEAPGDGV